MLRHFVAVACLLASGCQLAVNFEECNKDVDCAGHSDAGIAYCTSDHLCIADVPEERLCTSGFYGADHTNPDTIMIAGLFRLSGAAGPKDAEMAQAAQMAITELRDINQTRPIGLVLCDTGGDKTLAPRSIEHALSQYKIVGVVGPTTSSDVIASSVFVVAHDIAIISASATSPAIAGIDDHGLIWRTAANDNLQATVLAAVVPVMMSAQAPAPTQVNLSYVDSAYGSGLRSAFVNEWTKRSGAGPKATHAFKEGGSPDSITADLASDTPDYSVIVADSDAAAIVGALYKNPAGLTTTQFLFTDGAKGPELIGVMPNPMVTSRIRGTAPATPSGSVFDNFKLNYIDLFKSDPTNTSFVANAYDATYALTLAIAGSPPDAPVGGSTIAAALMRMSTPASLKVSVGPVDFIKGATALSGGGKIDLAGASGPLTWDNATGDLTEAPIEVWGITGNPPRFCTYNASLTLCP